MDSASQMRSAQLTSISFGSFTHSFADTSWICCAMVCGYWQWNAIHGPPWAQGWLFVQGHWSWGLVVPWLGDTAGTASRVAVLRASINISINELGLNDCPVFSRGSVEHPCWYKLVFCLVLQGPLRASFGGPGPEGAMAQSSLEPVNLEHCNIPRG